MRVLDEMVDVAMKAGWDSAQHYPLTRAKMIKALEAVLPMVRERLLRDGAEAVALHAYRKHATEMGFPITWDKETEPHKETWRSPARQALSEAFDGAFPEDRLDAAEGGQR